MGKLKVIYFLMFFAISTLAFSDELTPQPGFYGRVDVGFSSARDPELSIPSGALPANLGSSFLFGGGLGYTYVPGIRADLTLNYRSGLQQVSGFPAMPEGTADLKSLTALASIYLDLLPRERLSPFVGFGLGMSRNELDTITIKNPDGSLLGTIGGNKKDNFAWQFCAGGVLVLRDNLLIDAGYHYLSAGDYESDEALHFPDGTTASALTRGTVRAHEFIASIQFIF